MSAIGLVETGRKDSPGDVWRPWPWAVNAEGKGMLFDTKAEAIAAVRLLQADGVRSIDVGCMQVNLMHHPDAFATLDEAFDPKRNAHYAARFLGQLFRKSGNWIVAAGWYHSTTTDLAAAYVKKIVALLPGGKNGALAARWTSRQAAASRAPVVGRDGVILPSVRLNDSGLAPTRPARRYIDATGQSRAQYNG
jgi:hypothetical protein